MSVFRRATLLLVFLSALTVLLSAQWAPAQGSSGDPDEIADRIGSGSPSAGEGKAAACQACHGKEARLQQGATPQLDGQYAGYILNQLSAFDGGIRRHPAIDKLNDVDAADIAAWFASSQRAAASASEHDAVAAKLFVEGDRSRNVLPCVSCHGAGGKGALSGSDSYPALAGQSAPYLVEQLKRFRSAERSNGVMNIVAKSLSDAEIQALSNYLAGL